MPRKRCFTSSSILDSRVHEFMRHFNPAFCLITFYPLVPISAQDGWLSKCWSWGVKIRVVGKILILFNFSVKTVLLKKQKSVIVLISCKVSWNPAPQCCSHSSTIIGTPSQSNLDLPETAVPKIDLVLFEWREHALSCKMFFLFFPVLTANHFILKTTKNNPAYVFLIIVPPDSPCTLLSFSLYYF